MNTPSFTGALTYPDDIVKELETIKKEKKDLIDWLTDMVKKSKSSIEHTAYKSCLTKVQGE